MASGTKLVLEFYSATERTIQFTYSEARPNLGETAVNELMDTMITNGSIFTTPPARKKGAKLVTTTENVYDIDDELSNKLAEPINGNPDVGEPGENETVEVEKVEAGKQ